MNRSSARTGLNSTFMISATAAPPALWAVFGAPEAVFLMTSIYAKTGARNRVQLVNLLNRPDQGPRP